MAEKKRPKPPKKPKQPKTGDGVAAKLAKIFFGGKS